MCRVRGQQGGQSTDRPDFSRLPSARGAAADVALALALVVAAALVRAVHLQQIPRFTDEAEEVAFALAIARHGAMPLASLDSYNGPLFHYLLAFGFKLGGGLEWPRLAALLAGSLTVGLTYLLGRSLAAIALPERPVAGRVAGAIGAAGMCVAFIPVAVNSHIAWSNATTPLWTTLFALLVAEAVRRDRPQWLLAAGIAAGMAQQTHPSALAVLVGVAAWLVTVRPAWLRSRWPWLGLIASIAAVGNLLVYNVATGGGSVDLARERDYAFTGQLSGSAFRTNLAGFARLGYQLTTSTFLAEIDETTDATALRALLLHPAPAALAVLALAAHAFVGRRAGLGMWCWVAGAAILPVFNQAYHHFILARYLSPLLPPTMATIGVLLAAALMPPVTRGVVPRTISIAFGAAMVLLVTAYPAQRLTRFYEREQAVARTNERIWQLMPVLVRYGGADGPIVIDRELRKVRLTAGGNLMNVPVGLLSITGTPHDVVKQSRQLDLPDGAIVLLSDGQRDLLSAPHFVLEPIALDEPLAPAAPGQYGLYRVRRVPPATTRDRP